MVVGAVEVFAAIFPSAFRTQICAYGSDPFRAAYFSVSLGFAGLGLQCSGVTCDAPLSCNWPRTNHDLPFIFAYISPHFLHSNISAPQ